MQKNKIEKQITAMEENEIVVYELYVKEGVKRGRLPYTPNFERIVTGYNTQLSRSETEHEIWVLLEKVLKGGERQIEAYLKRRRLRKAA